MLISTMLTMLGKGFLKSVMIFALTLAGSLPLGLLVALGRMSRIKPVQWIVKVYISIMRGTPLMLQLMVVFFGPSYLCRAVGKLLTGEPYIISLGTNYRIIAVVIGFIINYAAYFAEIYRGGIESMPKGQYEAAEIMGYSKAHTFLRIILPQVIKRVLPSVTNEMITLVKDTSLAFAISYSEMFTIAKQISSSQTTLMPFVIAGLFYYVFNYIVAFGMERIEKKLSYYR